MVIAVAACGTPAAEQPAPSGSPTGRASPAPAGQLPEDTDPMAWFGERVFPLMLQQGPAPTNPVYSPLSIYLALGMVSDGARGDTAQQFTQVLGADRDSVNRDAAAVLKDYAQYQGPDGGERQAGGPDDGAPVKPVLNVADAIWVDQGFPIEDSFRHDVAEFYQSDASELDLQLPASTVKINDWVSKNTNGLIDKIIQPEDTTDLRVFLANALYFKGQWASPAIAGHTAPADFTTGTGKTVKADMMTFDSLAGGYLELPDGTKGALMDYTDGRFAMLTVMPGGGVESLAWDGQTISKWLDQVEDKPTKSLVVKLPKWQTDSGPVDLIPVLKAAGLEAPFDPVTADLSGIGEGDLYINLIRHRAVVNVDEDGTEAAAVTAVGVADSAYADPTTIEFNQPFVYSIIDKATGLPLFLGIINDPTDR
jgi:serpin B